MRRVTSRLQPWSRIGRGLVVICYTTLLFPDGRTVMAQETPQGAQPSAPDTTAAAPVAKIPPEQLESLVAPIALYPDPLLAQTLVASTYPLEIVQLHQYLAEASEPEGPGAGRFRGHAALGPEHPVDGRTTGCGEATRRRHPVDHRPGERLPRAAE